MNHSERIHTCHSSFRCQRCLLDESALLSSLEGEVKEALQQRLRQRSFKRRQVLYREAQDVGHVFFLLSGTVKLYRTHANGRQQIHCLRRGSGDLIGIDDLFGKMYSSTAQALTETRVCAIERDELRRLLERYPSLSSILLRITTHIIDGYTCHLALGQMSATERVARYLVGLPVREEVRRDLRSDFLTRMELAEMIGVTERTLIRSLKRLESEGVISLARNGFVIHDYPELTRISGVEPVG